MVLTLLSMVQRSIDSLCQTVKQNIRQRIKPDTHQLVFSAIVDLTRPKAELVLENAFLRQQLIVLQRQKKRPALTGRDRVMMVLLASKLRRWKETLIVVQPDTLMRWPLPAEGCSYPCLRRDCCADTCAGYLRHPCKYMALTQK